MSKCHESAIHSANGYQNESLYSDMSGVTVESIPSVGGVKVIPSTQGGNVIIVVV